MAVLGHFCVESLASVLRQIPCQLTVDLVDRTVGLVHCWKLPRMIAHQHTHTKNKRRRRRRQNHSNPLEHWCQVNKKGLLKKQLRYRKADMWFGCDFPSSFPWLPKAGLHTWMSVHPVTSQSTKAARMSSTVVMTPTVCVYKISFFTIHRTKVLEIVFVETFFCM